MKIEIGKTNQQSKGLQVLTCLNQLAQELDTAGLHAVAATARGLLDSVDPQELLQKPVESVECHHASASSSEAASGLTDAPVTAYEALATVASSLENHESPVVRTAAVRLRLATTHNT